MFLRRQILAFSTDVCPTVYGSGISGSAASSWPLSWFCRSSLLFHQLISPAKACSKVCFLVSQVFMFFQLFSVSPPVFFSGIFTTT
jgi:hypothetical protein